MDKRTWIQKKIEALVTNDLGFYHYDYYGFDPVESEADLNEYLNQLDVRVSVNEMKSFDQARNDFMEHTAHSYCFNSSETSPTREEFYKHDEPPEIRSSVGIPWISTLPPYTK